MKSQLESLVRQMQDGGITYHEAVHEFRKTFLKEMLHRHGGNQSRTATALGVHRNTLSRAMVEFGIAAKRPRAVTPHSAKPNARTA